MNAIKALAVFESDDTQRFEELLEDQLSSSVLEIPVSDYLENGGAPDPASFDSHISNVREDEFNVYADLTVHFKENHPSSGDDFYTDCYTAKFKLRIEKQGGEVHFEDGGYRNTTDDQDDDEDDE
jgi:hypothetical protein